MNRFAIVVALAPFLWTTAAAAQQYALPYDRVGRPYLDAGIGAFEPESSSALKNQSGQWAAAVGGGYRPSQHFAWGVEISGFQQRVDTPPGVQSSFFVTVEGRSRISSEGLAFTARYIVPLDRWEPYVGGGIGWYRSTLEVRGRSFLFSETVAEEKSSDFGAHVLAGVDFWIRPRIALGAELRYLRLNASFGDLVPGEVHAGGTFLVLRYRQSF
jgi:opacity protein-like surface antigen